METTISIPNEIEHRKLSTNRKKVNYAKWGYIFIIPFFLVYAIFSLWPLIQTFWFSMFEYYTDVESLREIGPNFIGFQNYSSLLSSSQFGEYMKNTLILWVLCFVPQIAVSLLLAVWFTDRRLKIRGQRFFKTVMYMPNLIMAAAFGYLFQTLLSPNGPIVNVLLESGVIPERFDVLDSVWGTRVVIGFMNFLMWFGNTTLLLMSGVMGIDEDVFEAATVDGAGAFRTFKDITMPLLRPIFVYVFITSLIGGIQLYDVAQLFTKNSGGPNMTSMTLIMYLNQVFTVSSNYGLAGAISVVIFLITGALSLVVFFVSYKDKLPKRHKKVMNNGNK